MRQQGEPTDDWASHSRLGPGPAERRALRRSVLLPFMIVSAIVAASIGITLALRSPAQVALLSDAMLTALLLCPLAACMFPLVLLSIALVTVLHRWRPKSRSPLRRLEAWTAMTEQNVEGWLGNVDERVLNWAVRLEHMRELLTAFDPPAGETNDEGIE